jgi:hypothetical protein
MSLSSVKDSSLLVTKECMLPYVIKSKLPSVLRHSPKSKRIIELLIGRNIPVSELFKRI